MRFLLHLYKCLRLLLFNLLVVGLSFHLQIVSPGSSENSLSVGLQGLLVAGSAEALPVPGAGGAARVGTELGCGGGHVDTWRVGGRLKESEGLGSIRD